MVRGRRTQVLRPTEEQTVVSDVAPVLISPEVVDAVRAWLAVNKRLSTRNNQNPEAALLRGGYALCGYCGGTMQVNTGAAPSTAARRATATSSAAPTTASWRRCRAPPMATGRGGIDEAGHCRH